MKKKKNLYSASVFLSGSTTASFTIPKLTGKEFMYALKEGLRVPQDSFIRQTTGTFKSSKNHVLGLDLLSNLMRYRHSNTITIECATEYTETPYRHFSLVVTVEDPMAAAS